VISRASVPAEPTFPKIVPMTAIASMAMLLLCIGWIVSAEFVSGRALVRVTSTPAKPRQLPEIATDAALPVAAGSPPPPPLEDRMAMLRSAVEPIVAERAAAVAEAQVPAGDVVEDIIDLRDAIVRRGSTRVAVVAASGAGRFDPIIEDLSFAAAEHGTRVVVIDTVPSNVGLKVPGLSDLIAGEAAFGEVIGRNRVTRAHEIGVGTAPLLFDDKAAEVFDTVLAALESAYDVVVLSLGEISAMDSRKRLVPAARHVVIVGCPDDPRVAMAHREMKQAGAAAVTVIAPVSRRVEAAA
jgi:hypothetical protein